jgi:hypothetical protein
VPSVPELPDATPEVPEDVAVRSATDRKVVKVSLIADRALPAAGRVGVLWIPEEARPMVPPVPELPDATPEVPDVLVLGVGSTQPVLLPETVEARTAAACTTAVGAVGAAGLTPVGPKWFWVFEFKTAGGIG